VKLAILHGHICTANDDGTVPLNSRSLLWFNRFDDSAAAGAALLLDMHNDLFEAVDEFLAEIGPGGAHEGRYPESVAVEMMREALRKAKGEA